jgi:hypothetical protein
MGVLGGAAAVIAGAITASVVVGGLHHGARAGPPASASQSAATPTSVSQSAAKPTSASQSADVWFVTVDDMRRGDCLTGSNLGLGKRGDWPETVQAVPCPQPHLAEVFYASNYWAANKAYPGDHALNAQAGSRCERPSARMLGSPGQSRSSISTWSFHTPMTGARVTDFWCASPTDRRTRPREERGSTEQSKVVVSDE